MHIEKVDLGLLRCFAVLMQEKSVSRAAEKLDITQPAVSHALARLRILFDDPLLLRANRGMTPTARALDLEGRVQRLLGDVEDLVAPVAPFDPRHTRTTFVMTSTTYGELVLAPSLAEALRSEAPGIDIQFRQPQFDLLPGWLERGEVDLRIGWVRDPHPLLRSKSLFGDKLVCIARRAHPKLKGSVDIRQFVELPHVRAQLPESVTTSRVVDKAVAELGLSLRTLLLVNNVLIIPYAVARTDGIAIVPARLAQIFAEPLKLQILEVPLKLPALKYAMFWHERAQHEVRHRWLRQMVADVARNLSRSAI